MSETAEQNQAQQPQGSSAQDSPIVHRICEACNNMFAVPAADPNHRCPKCHK